ncbi:MAG: RDD family protein [Opitutales bacterium]
MEPPVVTPPQKESVTPPPLPDLGALSPAARLRPGSFRWRALAFLLDFALLVVATCLILDRVVWPQYEGGEAEMRAFSEQVLHVAVESAGASDFRASLPEPSESLKKMLGASQMAVLLTFWMGFFLGDTLMGGRSLGKRVFRLRVVPRDRLGPLRMTEGLLRSGLKTLTLLASPLLPFLLANYLVPLFGRDRRAGYDFLCRTLVISEPASDASAIQSDGKSG